MKILHLLALVCAATTLTTTLATAQEPSAWRWGQDVDVATRGMKRLDLPPATLGASQPSLADLRLISPEGEETAWLLDDSIPPPLRDIAATGFKATLDERNTVLSASNTAGRIESVTLQTPARDFLKSARVDGSRDGATWIPLATGEVIFRQSGGASRLRIPFPPGDWPQLRVTLDDDRSPPVPFTGLLVTPAESRPETEPHPVTIRRRTEEGDSTVLVLYLGAKNLLLAELKLEVPDGVFSRKCQVSISEQTIASAIIYRVVGEEGASAASLTIPFHRRIPSDRLTLTIRNGDSPPLGIAGVGATRHPDRLLFFASQPGMWKLLTGNRHAIAPRYDLGSLRGELGRVSADLLTPGPLIANPAYQAPPTLPEVEPAGSMIDLSEWGRRRAVRAAFPGVIRIELDVPALSHISSLALADLRLVQNDRQIPWLREPDPQLRQLPVQATLEPDPKRPTVSRWKIATPSAGLPIHRIEMQSPDPLFTRSLRFLQRGKDELGNPWTRMLATETWTKAPGGGNSRETLGVPLGDVRISDALWVETDHGDNPPIRLENVTFVYQQPAVIAKITNDAPAFLYYENPNAILPKYDIGLVRSELLSADKQTAKLGPEEILEPGRRPGDRELSAGSPWLWVALAVVVVALLVIVAKVLPKPSELS
jgi:hypothetical protein